MVPQRAALTQVAIPVMNKQILAPLLSAALAFMASQALAASADTLVGAWRADTKIGAPGTLVFEKKGHAVTLKPAGFPPVAGTWTIEDGYLLRMAVPNMGESLSAFHIDGGRLTLQHSDGQREVFTRLGQKPQPSSAAKEGGRNPGGRTTKATAPVTQKP